MRCRMMHPRIFAERFRRGRVPCATFFPTHRFLVPAQMRPRRIPSRQEDVRCNRAGLRVADPTLWYKPRGRRIS